MTMRHDLEDFTDRPRPAEPVQTKDDVQGVPAAVSFGGKRRSLLAVSLVNTLLTLLTLGIFGFWAKTKTRRYFWSNVRLQNEPLKYTGTAVELLIGFLTLVAILVAIYALYEGALLLGPYFPGALQRAVQVAFALAVIGFFQYTFYRMWRYRFSRTTWHGAKFTQVGSTLKYLGMSIGWLIASFFTLGLAYPWLRNAQWKHRIEHLQFGQNRLTYSGHASELSLVWLKSFVPMVVIAIPVGVFFYDQLEKLNPTIIQWSGVNLEQIGIYFGQRTPFLILFATILFAVILYIWYRVSEANYIFNHTHLGESAINSRLEPLKIVAMFIVTALGSVVFFALMFFMLVYFLPLGIFPVELKTPDPNLIYTTMALICSLIVFPVIRAIGLHHAIASHICAHLQIINPDTFMSAAQSKATKQDV